MLKEQSHNKVHSLAVRNLWVVHGVGVKHIEQLIFACFMVDFEFLVAQHRSSEIFHDFVLNLRILLVFKVLVQFFCCLNVL